MNCSFPSNLNVSVQSLFTNVSLGLAQNLASGRCSVYFCWTIEGMSQEAGREASQLVRIMWVSFDQTFGLKLSGIKTLQLPYHILSGSQFISNEVISVELDKWWRWEISESCEATPRRLPYLSVASSSSVKRGMMSGSGLSWVTHLALRHVAGAPLPLCISNNLEDVDPVLWVHPRHIGSDQKIWRKKIQLQVTIPPAILQPRDAWWPQGKEPKRKCHSKVFSHFCRTWAPCPWVGRDRAL